MNNEEVNTVTTPEQPVAPAAQPAAPAPKKGLNLVLLIPICIICLIVLVLLFLAVTTKTLKCKSESEYGGVETKTISKEKFRFGKPIKSYYKAVSDYSDSDYDKSDLKDMVTEAKKSYKKLCKKSDGCKYSIKQSGKKITVVVQKKYDKEDREDFEDAYDSFKEYKEKFEDSCDED